MSAKMHKSMIETNEEYGAGRVEPEKEKNPNLEMMLIDDFDMDLLTPEDEASRKRKPCEMEADGQMSAKMHKSMIETNEEYGAGRVEPEKEKNPNLEMMLIDDFNMDLLTPEDEASRKRKSSEMGADGQMSAKMPKTMIETNQQFGAGR